MHPLLPSIDGTLRWQAPELMIGLSGLTPAVDVYAFAICCVEVMANGALPWPHADDDAVRHFVLSGLLLLLCSLTHSLTTISLTQRSI